MMQKSYLAIRRGSGWVAEDDEMQKNKPPKMRSSGYRGRKSKEKK